MKGSYILLIKLPEEQTVTIGSLQALHFPGGYYAYVGSARLMTGLNALSLRLLTINLNLFLALAVVTASAAATSFLANEESQLVIVIVRIYIHGIAFAAASTSLHKIAPARVSLTGAITNDPCPHSS